MPKRDYYEILEASHNASTQELKKAYRKLAMKYHPDQNHDDEQAADRFKELTEAYKVLSDPKKRRNYDQFGHEGFTDSFGDPFMDISSMTDFFESVFGSVFTGGAYQRGVKRGTSGRDLQYDLDMTLKQVVEGARMKITIPRPVRCSSCTGTGAQKGTKPAICSGCGGTGTILLQQGIFSMKSTCNMCLGKGEVIKHKCTDCGGVGLEEKESEIDLTIPAGVEDNSVKIISGLGEEGRGGAPDGSLHIMIHVKKHPLFLRRGADLHSVISISYPQAVLGCEVEVETINNKVMMKIKPGTKNGQTYKLKGRGIPSTGRGFTGNQMVHVEIDIPQKVSDKTRTLLHELGRELGNPECSKPHSFIDKLKGFFE